MDYAQPICMVITMERGNRYIDRICVIIYQKCRVWGMERADLIIEITCQDGQVGRCQIFITDVFSLKNE